MDFILTVRCAVSDTASAGRLCVTGYVDRRRELAVNYRTVSDITCHISLVLCLGKTKEFFFKF
jgi:hypothetical protein